MEIKGSRRAFVGAAVAGTALLGPLAFFRNVGSSAAGEAVVAGRGNALAPVPVKIAANSEAAKWQSAIGTQFRVSSSNGAVTATLSNVQAHAIKGKRPADIRQESYALEFSFDRNGTVLQDGIYALDHAVEGLTQLFMQPRMATGAGVKMLAIIG